MSLLAAEVAGLFAELDGYHEYEVELAMRGAYVLSRRAEAKRAAYPAAYVVEKRRRQTIGRDGYNAYQRKYARSRYATDPEFRARKIAGVIASRKRRRALLALQPSGSEGA